MMEGSRRIRRISHSVRSPRTRRRDETARSFALRPVADLRSTPRRSVARPLPVSLPPRPVRPAPRLLLAASNPAPRAPSREVHPPALQLVRRGLAPAALTVRFSVPFARLPVRTQTHVGQLLVVGALAAVGLLAFVASVGQILSRAM